MKCCTFLILIGLMSVHSYAQAPGSAEAHVAAAKTIQASVPNDAKNELDYDYIIATECSPPKPATPAQEARQLQAKANAEAMPATSGIATRREVRVQYFPDWPTGLKTNLASIRKWKEIEAKEGVDTMITIHSTIDKMNDKLAALKTRKPGDPHPFVNKEMRKRFLNLLDECVSAQLDWRSKT
jgi:hypothetical protein